MEAHREIIDFRIAQNSWLDFLLYQDKPGRNYYTWIRRLDGR
ncbi:MAG: hypothetical protein PVH61_32705 [Candidatus Aminicenantes bacterium]